jgi:rare lipoprotein A
MHIRTFGTVLLLGTLLLTGCAKKKRVHTPPPPKIGDVELGIASWYGDPYHGRRAANGEIYDMEAMTAAHRTLPFETWVEVENLTNRRMVTVRITDRGPFVDGRIVDLSRAAARRIDMIGPGTAKVKLKIVAPPRNVSPKNIYTVQVGAFRDRSRADGLRAELKDRFGTATIVERPGDPTLWRVLVGKESSIAAAQEIAEQIRLQFGAAFVVRLDEAAN